VSGDNEELLDAITAILPPLLHAMDGLVFIGRYLQPSRLAEMIEQIEAPDVALRAPLATFRDAAWPARLIDFKNRIEDASEAMFEAYDGLRGAQSPENGRTQARRAARRLARASEAIYPIASMLPPVSQFFLEDDVREDAALEARLMAGDSDNLGVLHANNDRGMRGGFSVYVPETYDPETAAPLIVALHGGFGHGRLFLWSWIREARSRGAILLCPTSLGDTWSLMEPEVDRASLDRMLAQIGEKWRIDPAQKLLTGMSDGGTFTYLYGLLEDSPFTHLAPMSSGFHPLLLEGVDMDRLSNLPIYIVHGAKDWMFAPGSAQEIHQVLSERGAKSVYRELPDLGHTHPRDENGPIMDWFLNDNP
jgi:phospholipase/carboxylesterase